MIKVKTVDPGIVQKGVQTAKVQIFAPQNVGQAPTLAPPGIDASPIAGMTAIYGATTANGVNVIIGYINTGALAEAGEIRIFSTDAQGALKAFVHAKKNGDLHLNGNTKHLTVFEEMKTAFDNFRTDFNNFVTNTYNAHTHASDGAPAVPLGTASSVNMDDAKADTLKTK